MRFVVLALCLLPLACAPNAPQLDARLSPEARAADYPRLVPLGPLLAAAEAPRIRNAAPEGASLEARAAELRRRAAWLRSLPL